MRTRSRQYVGVAAIILANFIWSGSFSATAIAVHGMSPAFISMVRLGTGALVLSPFLKLSKGSKWDWKTIFLALMLGAIGFAAPVYLETVGLALSTPALAAISIALEPLFTVVIASLLLRERLNWSRRLALAVAFVGAWAIAGLPRPGKSGYLAGDLLLIAAVFCYAIYNAYSQRLAGKLSSAAATSATLWGGFLSSIPIWLLTGGDVPHSLRFPDWTALLYLALVATASAYVLWMFALKIIPVSQAALFLYMQPVFGVLLSVMIVGTRPGWYFYLGAGLILFAILLGRERAARQPSHK
ncbi:MAG: hypothetical protein A2201_02640 [Alicyclobacillus sp. RIFOXYA1_FULL_53_8]|nr:MAG: hypothetical protein A2201_02640 [Alicyclobacillus sp. RIFOXYA1_FULL_53_8]